MIAVVAQGDRQQLLGRDVLRVGPAHLQERVARLVWTPDGREDPRHVDEVLDGGEVSHAAADVAAAVEGLRGAAVVAGPREEAGRLLELAGLEEPGRGGRVLATREDPLPCGRSEAPRLAPGLHGALMLLQRRPALRGDDPLLVGVRPLRAQPRRRLGLAACLQGGRRPKQLARPTPRRSGPLVLAGLLVELRRLDRLAQVSPDVAGLHRVAVLLEGEDGHLGLARAQVDRGRGEGLAALLEDLGGAVEIPLLLIQARRLVHPAQAHEPLDRRADLPARERLGDPALHPPMARTTPPHRAERRGGHDDQSDARQRPRKRLDGELGEHTPCWGRSTRSSTGDTPQLARVKSERVAMGWGSQTIARRGSPGGG